MPGTAPIPDDGRNEVVVIREDEMLEALHEWGPGPWFLVVPLFWLAVVVTLAFFFGGRRRRWHVGSAEAALAERYARGEITEEEYRRAVSVLKEAR
jgi:putative membrane protein